MPPTWALKRLNTVDDSQIDALADVLIDCVTGGASVSFMLPLTRDRAVEFWRRVAQEVAAGRRVLLVAEDQQGICGTVQLILDLPENQPHRADLAKMLVHRRARRQGLGAALMKAAEELAWRCGKTLLVLDAVTHGDAARLYERLGWVRVGDVPNFALMPSGESCSTTYYYRNLPAPSTCETPARLSARQTTIPVELKIRTATMDDSRAVCRLLHELDDHHVRIRPDVFQPFDDSHRVRERIAPFVNRDDAELFVAEIHADLVGLATVRISGNPQGPMFRSGLHACIDDLHVRSEFRRLGIAKMLLNRVIEWTKTRQLQRIDITVWNENQTGMSFFKAYGFNPRCQKMQFDITNSVNREVRVEGI